MADNTAQFANEAQEVTRSMYNAAQGMGQNHLDVIQRLGEVQQNVISQSVEAANDQLQLLSRVRDPREFASAQADLVKSHGQRYIESVNKAMDIIADAWQEYGDRLERTMNTASDKTSRTSSSRKTA